MTRTHRITALVLCCLGLAVVEARAETTFGVHTFSVHAPQRDQTNDNAGLYVRKDQWQVGAYRNSHDRTTVYGGYAAPVGPVELMLGAASGYDKRCDTTVTHIPAVVKHEKYANGDGSTTTYPARTVTTETCTGFSNTRLTPLVALSYAAPFTVLNVRPRVWLMPGFGKVSTVAHLSLEWSL